MAGGAAVGGICWGAGTEGVEGGVGGGDWLRDSNKRWRVASLHLPIPTSSYLINKPLK